MGRIILTDVEAQPRAGNYFETPRWVTQGALAVMAGRTYMFSRPLIILTDAYGREFPPPVLEAPWPTVGDTITVRKPKRFVDTVTDYYED